MTGEILYRFSVFEPMLKYIFFGTFLILSGLVIFLVHYDDAPGSALILSTILIVCGILCFKKSTNNKVDYVITKIEAFTDFEKAVKENQSVEMIDDNIFLVKLKKKNQ